MAAAAPLVTEVNVEGNENVVARHIVSAVKTKAGEELDREQLKEDVEAIYELGYFSVVDVKLTPQPPDGVTVTFQVTENPTIKDIRFRGNDAFSDEELGKIVFSSPGTVFNRVFFQHDLQRIKEHYQDAGYVLVRVRDVQVENGIISVQIIEPKVKEIIIQGNKKTKTDVIRRRIKLEPGDLFNSKILRHSLNKLQQMGYFEDVNVGFEPGEDPSQVTLVLTVQEKRTGSVTFSVGHGSSSGWSGGVGYEDTNWQGLGHTLGVGFELGDREEYWARYSDTYMDETRYAWKVGVYQRNWEEMNHYEDGEWQFEYDEEKKGMYVGAGKKFRGNPQLSWYVTVDWHDTDITATSGDFDPYYVREKLLGGKTFSLTGQLKRSTLDEYLSYPDGDEESLNVEKAFEALGGDFDFTKYWLDARYYKPVTGLGQYIDIGQLEDVNEDNPPIFAARVRSGFSSGSVPWAEQYFLGGNNDLRGYRDDEFAGDEMFLANVEFRLPIKDAFSVVAFYDSGMAWDTDVGKEFDLGTLKDAFGVGFRVVTPIGNLRLDVAEGDEETRTHFGFGEMF
ncbi:MAG: BamA/TamA family outer membrane protein [Synergistales bacterium]|nr:BamA/TamA family outer membrane protein [Synergistales bacterium]